MAVVLIVDDRAEIRTLLRAVIEREGHQSLVAESAHEARLLLDKGPAPALLCTDVGLPGENGIDFVIKLRNSAAYGNLAVLFVTANPDSIERRKIPGTGLVETLAKPFRFDQVAALLRELLPAAGATTRGPS